MKELEKKALDCVKNHSHTLVQNATESDIEKREMELYIDGYKQCKREMQKENGRAKVLLKATFDLLQKQKESHYVLNLLENTVFYDNAECDGYCLVDDIENFLNCGS